MNEPNQPPIQPLNSMMAYLYSWVIVRRLLKEHGDGEDFVYNLALLVRMQGTTDEHRKFMARFLSVKETDAREFFHKIAMIMSDELSIPTFELIAKYEVEELGLRDGIKDRR